MMPSLVTTLDQIAPADAPRVGGKALGCARLKQAGVPVPDGIVLTTDAMGDATAGSLDLPELHAWLARLPSGVLLAVRSSGTEEDSAAVSFAGIHETRLDVAPDDVADAVRACWDSISSPQALAYRQARNLSTENPRTAVLIQRMVRAVASGVAFTMDPITGARDEIVINSVFGLGEELVSGRVQPDGFRLRKSGEVMSAHTVNDPPSLDAGQLAELARLLLTIERHHGAPQDVEWCHDGRQFWVVQSRPITTADTAPTRDPEWTRANLREVFPDLPSPMAALMACEGLNQAWREVYGRLLAPESELGPVSAVFHGRLYFNVDQMRHICRATGWAPGAVLRSIGHPGIAPEDDVVQRPPLREVVRVLPDLLRLVWSAVTVGWRARAQVRRMEDAIERLASEDPRTLSERELGSTIADSQARLAGEIHVVLILGAALSSSEEILRMICARAGMSFERLVHAHLAAGEKTVSGQQALDLLRLARIARDEGGVSGSVFTQRFAEFIDRYGHRGRYESDLSLPRYREDPAPLRFAIEAHVAAPECPDPDLIEKRQEEERATAWAEFERRLNPRQLALIGPVRWLLRRTKRLYLWREQCRSDMMRAAFFVRQRHLAGAAGFVARGWLPARDDYFLLTLPEVGAAIDDPAAGAGLGTIVDRRKLERDRWAAIDMPVLLRESQLPALARHLGARPGDTDASVLHGLCVSAGAVEAEVVVIRDPRDFKRMRPGAILVAPATDPGWTPLFTLASGLIVEVGGMLSHASTVAREYGLPALANVPGATTILRDGERVRLDATNGVVHRATPD